MICPHGMPTPASCLDCMETTGLGATPEEQEVAAGPEIPASFPGYCQPGDDRIEAGDLIVTTSEGRWAHPGCLP